MQEEGRIHSTKHMLKHMDLAGFPRPQLLASDIQHLQLHHPEQIELGKHAEAIHVEIS